MTRSKGLFVQVSTKLWCDDEHDVSLAAWGLWVKLLSACGDGLTDGYVTDKMFRRVTVGEDPEECALLAKELTENGLLGSDETGWQMVGYSKWNKTRSQIDSERKAAAKRAAKAREKRTTATKTAGVT